MRIVLTGGTGFIGAPLAQALVEKGHEVTILTRQALASGRGKNPAFVAWSQDGGAAWKQALRECGAVINLAGEPIAARRWTPEQKQRIRDSRVVTTRNLVEALREQGARPGVFLGASAVGFYGPRGDEPLGEGAPPGPGFLAKTCQAWEAETRRAEGVAGRTVLLRIGVVLGRGGGALAKMVPPFKMFAGRPLGSGRQWMPWVHQADIIGLALFLLEHPSAAGPINATAPNPERMRDFCKTLGRVLHRPSWAPVPAPVLRLMLGEMADMLLTGQRVIPEAAQKLGYRFRFPSLEAALVDCLT